MKKYIGLLCGAMLLVALVAGCSGAYGFDGNNGGSGGGGNPFAGTTWECAGYGITYKLSFDKDKVKYNNGYTNVPFSYSWEQDPESKEYVANMVNEYASSVTMKFWITDVDADKGSLDGLEFTRKK